MKIKIIYIVAAIFFTPTIIFGSSFVSSLIQGKTPEEAVQIIANQLDALFGRVETLETKQVQDSQNIEQAQLELERLRLENENLKLKAEENEKAIGLVNRCKALETPMTCRGNAVRSYQEALAIIDLPLSASLQEVVVVSGASIPPWYTKAAADELCIMRVGNIEQCYSRIQQINLINTDRANKRNNASQNLQPALLEFQKMKDEFDSLSCQAVLDKYLPIRPEPGCG